MIALALILLVAPPEPNVSDIVRVIGDGTMAHACPLPGGLLVTNAHVVPKAIFGEDRLAIVRWSDGSDHEGLAERVSLVPGADLAILRVLGDVHPATEYPIHVARPAPGDKVTVRGYRYDTRNKAMAERLVEAKVTRMEAGHLFFTYSAEPGSSGSCVLLWNEGAQRWEAVAVNKGGIRLETNGGKDTSGFAVGLWGLWGKFE